MNSCREMEGIGGIFPRDLEWPRIVYSDAKLAVILGAKQKRNIIECSGKLRAFVLDFTEINLIDFSTGIVGAG